MAPKQMISARLVAVRVLNRLDPKRTYAAAILERLLNRTNQKQRATDLVFGALRNRDAIDRIISTLSGKPVTRIPRHMLNVLRVAVYELTYNPETPAYSIVNEAVDSARLLAGTRQVGFVNAVLRTITRHITERTSSLSDCPATKTVPQTPLTGCRFDTDILPENESAFQAYLSAAFSIPRRLIDEWIRDYGPDNTREICFGSNRRPTVYVRANLLKTTVADLAAIFREAAIEVTEIPDAPVLGVRSPHNIRQLPGFEQGLFTVQDLTASLPVAILNPQPHWKILDLCAAPGVKTTQIAEATGDNARIIATDIDAKRLEMLRQNIARLGVQSITTIEHKHLERTFQETGPFDAILLDVPCSNTGVLAKRVEAHYRLTPETVKNLIRTQTGLLEASAKMLAISGCICYSTCSILNAENGDLLRSFLASHDEILLEHEHLTLPSAAKTDHDGGYFAILRRAETHKH